MNGNAATAARPYGADSGAPRESAIAGLGRTADALAAGLEELEKRLNPVLSPEGPAIAGGMRSDTPPHNEIRNLADRFEAVHGRLARLMARIDL